MLQFLIDSEDNACEPLKKTTIFNSLLALTIFLKERFATINNGAINFHIVTLFLKSKSKNIYPYRFLIKLYVISITKIFHI